MENKLEIEEMILADWNQVKAIYIEGINTGNATFQTTAPTWEEWDSAHNKKCRYVAKLNGEVVGWVALSPISNREVFEGVAEVSIYLNNSIKGMGIGSRLLAYLIEQSEHNGFWTLQAMIFPENMASIKLHKKFGFEEVGTRKQMGRLHGAWRDVVLLERRSNEVGVE